MTEWGDFVQVRIILGLLLLTILSLQFQNCVGNNSIKFFSMRTPIQSSMTGGSTYDGKPENGYYCRVFDNLKCQSQVQNVQGLIKVDDSGIHLIEDNCSSTSAHFLADDASVGFSKMASDHIGVTRGIFKKCEVNSANLPTVPSEMTEAYCTTSNDNLAVLINKNLSSKNSNFALYLNEGSTIRKATGDVLVAPMGNNTRYFSNTQDFNLDINAKDSQTFAGHLQVIVDDKDISVDLSCRQFSPLPSIIVEKDMEISPTWIDTSQLVAYWKLNEVNSANSSVILDSSRFASHGVLSTDNGNLIKTDSSVSGGALFFDGALDSVSIPRPADGHLDFDQNSFSFMVWIKKSGNTSSWDMPLWFGANNASTGGYDIECGSLGCAAAVSDGRRLATSMVTASFATNGNALIGRWVFLVAVVDRGSQQLRTYLNGSLVSTSSISAVGDIKTQPNLRIGSYDNPTNSPFWGSIDDISIWNRALSEKEIGEIFQRLRPKFY